MSFARGEVMRYEKADNLLQLALEMQAARGGPSLADIERKFGLGRGPGNGLAPLQLGRQGGSPRTAGTGRDG